MTMDTGCELLAQTCLIGGLSGSESLSLGIDLNSLGFDLAEFTETTQSIPQQYSPLTAEISALLGDAADKETGNMEQDDKLDGFDDLLDLDVSEDVWVAFNQADLLLSGSIMDSSSSAPTPGDPTDYSNQALAINSPPMSTMTAYSTMATSPAASDDCDEDSYASSSPGSNSAEPRLKRTRGRTIDKKQSNKAAATKYRTKKVAEKETLFAECADYERKNGELKRLIGDCQTEISFIKSLLVEALIAKNMAKSSTSS